MTNRYRLMNIYKYVTIVAFFAFVNCCFVKPESVQRPTDRMGESGVWRPVYGSF